MDIIHNKTFTNKLYLKLYLQTNLNLKFKWKLQKWPYFWKYNNVKRYLFNFNEGLKQLEKLLRYANSDIQKLDFKYYIFIQSKDIIFFVRWL